MRLGLPHRPAGSCQFSRAFGTPPAGSSKIKDFRRTKRHETYRSEEYRRHGRRPPSMDAVFASQNSPQVPGSALTLLKDPSRKACGIAAQAKREEVRGTAEGSKRKRIWGWRSPNFFKKRFRGTICFVLPYPMVKARFLRRSVPPWAQGPPRQAKDTSGLSRTTNGVSYRGR